MIAKKEKVFSQSQWELFKKNVSTISEEDWNSYQKKQLVEKIYGLFGMTDIDKAISEYGVLLNYDAPQTIVDLSNSNELKDLFSPIIEDNAIRSSIDENKKLVISDLKLIKHTVHDNVYEHYIHQDIGSNIAGYFLYFIYLNTKAEINLYDVHKKYLIKNNDIFFVPVFIENDFIVNAIVKDFKKIEQKPIFYIKGQVTYYEDK